MAGAVARLRRHWARRARRAAGVARETENLVSLLGAQGIDVVLDIGANVGQYAHSLRAAGWRGDIVSFEPGAAAHAALCEAAADDRRWRIAPRLALGAEAGTVTLHVAAASDMSSLRAVRTVTLKALPRAAVVADEEVPCQPLDAVFDDYVPAGARAFLKIDTQGSEAQVLDGASRALAACAGVQIEMSLLPLYEGEVPARVLWDRLAAAGFEARMVLPGYFSQRLNRQLQFDGVFFRARSAR